MTEDQLQMMVEIARRILADGNADPFRQQWAQCTLRFNDRRDVASAAAILIPQDDPIVTHREAA